MQKAVVDSNEIIDKINKSNINENKCILYSFR